MKFSVLTLFPEMFEPIKQSIIGKAEEKKLIDINLINIRDFSKNKHKKVDDTPYGGGAGMVMQADVVYDAYKSIKDENAKVIYLTPQGKVLNQQKVEKLSKEEHLILLCGHYEGIDERIIELCVDEEISIGDYVLTGGELPAMVLIDSVSRYVDGVLNEESILNLNEVDYIVIRNYLGKLYDDELKSSTIARKLSSLRSFYDYLLKYQEVKDNPFVLTKAPKLEKKNPIQNT